MKVYDVKISFMYFLEQGDSDNHYMRQTISTMCLHHLLFFVDIRFPCLNKSMTYILKILIFLLDSLWFGLAKRKTYAIVGKI